MNTSLSKRSNRIQKQLTTLELKKAQLVRRLHEASAHQNRLGNLQSTLTKLQRRLLEIDSEGEVARARLSKLQAKCKQYENARLEQVFKLQNQSMEREEIQNKAVEVFTPKVSLLDELRLRLIEIQSGEQLKGISHVFTMRKAIISFLKRQDLKWEEETSKGLEIYICEKDIVGQFEHHVLSILEQKKLTQFQLGILEPVKQYISILYQIKTALRTISSASSSAFNHTEAQNLILQLRDKQKCEKTACELIRTLTQKIDRTALKIDKYKQYLGELYKEKEELRRQAQNLTDSIQECSAYRIETNGIESELKEITEAIEYLSLKSSMGQNISMLHSPKTKDIFERCQQRWGSPALLSSH